MIWEDFVGKYYNIRDMNRRQDETIKQWKMYKNDIKSEIIRIQTQPMSLTP